MSNMQRIWENQEMKPEDSGLPICEIRRIIDERIFSKRHREIMYCRWLDGMKYADIAEMLDMSVRQIKNIVYKCEDKLSKHI